MDKNIYDKKIKKYSNDEINNIKSNKIKISKSDEDIISFVKESLDTKSSNKKIYYGKINALLAEQIYEKLGINVKDYNLSFRASNVRKIMKDHGNDYREKLR